jgi:hypothetical protein
MILVHNRVPYYENFQVAEAFHQFDYFLITISFSKLLQVVFGFRRKKRRSARSAKLLELKVISSVKKYLATVSFDRFPLVLYVARYIVHRGAILAAFDVHVRAQAGDNAHCSNVIIDRYEINASQRRERLRAQVFTKNGPARTLVDVSVPGQCNEQHIAFELGFLQVSNMPRMHQIKCTVAHYDALALLSKLFRFSTKRVEGQNFMA